MNREQLTEKICGAITEHKVIRFYYGAGERTVEPYVCGISRNNKLVLLGYQLGERGSGLRRWGWYMFDLVNISYLGVTKKEFTISRINPRRAFNPLTAKLKEVICSAFSPAEQALETDVSNRTHAAAK